MKRILFISQYLNRNGTEAFMMNVVRKMHNSDLTFDFLLYCEEETDYCKEVRSYSGRIFRVPSRKQSPFRWYLSLNSFFKNHSQDYLAIHFCGNSLTAIAPILFAWMYHIPIRIVHAHNSSASGFHNRVLHLIKRDLVRRISTHHLACSSKASDWFFGTHPSTIIKNGIDVDLFQFNQSIRSQTRSSLGIADGTLVLGHVGRFVTEKNHLFLLDIFSKVLEQRSDAKLLLIGDGPLREQIEQKAEALGIISNVSILGIRSDVHSLLQAIDVFIMPSIFEGFPFVLVEAQCAGLPCVISDTINKDICLSDNVHCLSLQSDVSKWVTSVLRICSKDRESGQQVVSSTGFSIQNTVLQLQKIYQL